MTAVARMSSPERDEWIMICPPGRMDEAEQMAEVMAQNIREIVESPVATDRFILINDTELDRAWAELMAAPISFRTAPVPFRDRPWQMFGPVISDPAALIRGLPGL